MSSTGSVTVDAADNSTMYETETSASGLSLKTLVYIFIGIIGFSDYGFVVAMYKPMRQSTVQLLHDQPECRGCQWFCSHCLFCCDP